MKKIYFYVLIMFISLAVSACSGQRFRAGSLEKERLVTKITADSSRTDSMFSLNRQGSIFIGREQYSQVAEIIPEGEFRYGPVRGFTGKAQKIRLNSTGKTERVRQDSSFRQTAAIQKMHFRQDTDMRKQLLKEEKQEIKKGSSIRWWVIGTACCLLAAWLIYRRLR